jgi:predicted Zn-ribbon and HTH transcriptional regulator
MKRFRCKNCTYDFDNKVKGKIDPPKVCPYCGEEDTVEVKKHIIEEL